MGENKAVQESLVDQILARMLAALEGGDEFDAEALGRLEQLAQAGGLGKAKRVADAIKGPEGGEP